MSETTPATQPLLFPQKINLGSGKKWHPDFLNVDILKERNPDLLLDFGEPFPFGQSFAFRRWGEHTIEKNQFQYILADNVLEHIQNLVVVMTNCLELLQLGGDMEIVVPYDLSYGAWQDPTHLRAFNERSWLYYTDWCWYLGWTTHRFDMIKLNYELSPYGGELMKTNPNLDSIIKMPRAVDAMRVILRKRACTPQETIAYEKYILA